MQNTNGNKSLGRVLRIVAVAAAVFALLYFTSSDDPVANYSNDMKIPYAVDLNDNGADDVERMGDHADSPYYNRYDFFNAVSGNGLTILPRFRTIQQTSWWSCGVSSVMMVLDYYGCLGNWNEQNLAALRTDHSSLHKGTCLDQMIEMMRGASDLTIETTYDHTADPDEIDCAWIKKQIDAGYPILVGWADWGGHWTVIIGYDTMGTEFGDDDVLIMADPYDTTDHNQDGYGVIGAERFLSMFTIYDMFPEDHPTQKLFIVVKPNGAAAK